MKNQFTITEMIVKGDLIEEIMKAYNIDENEATNLVIDVNKALEDDKVSEEEFQELCDSIDAQYQS